MEGLTEGRIVHYVLQDGPSKGQHRPAIVVNTWSNISTYQEESRINLMVFADGANDKLGYDSDYLYWATSILYSEEKELGTWHWIEKA